MKTNRFFLLSLLALICLPHLLKAQAEVFIADAVSGNPPLKSARYTDVHGSPFFSDNWLDGVVKLADGKLYKDVKLKYDQVLDEVFFLGQNNVTMAFKSPVLEFKIATASVDGLLSEAYFVNGFAPIDGATEKSYYQKLVYEKGSKIQLTKRNIKKIYESRVYNSAVTDKTVEPIVSYYISNDNKVLKKIKLDRKSVLAGIGNKQNELEKFAETNKLNLKKEEDVIKLLIYYNSI